MSELIRMIGAMIAVVVQSIIGGAEAPPPPPPPPVVAPAPAEVPDLSEVPEPGSDCTLFEDGSMRCELDDGGVYTGCVMPGWGCVTAPPPGLSFVPAGGEVCHEDMPCWDCATMGNLQCGPTRPTPVVLPGTCMAEWALRPQGVTQSEAAAECAEEEG